MDTIAHSLVDIIAKTISGILTSGYFGHNRIKGIRVLFTYSHNRTYLLVDTMATIASHHRVAMCLGMFLNYVSHLSIAHTWFYCKSQNEKRCTGKCWATCFWDLCFCLKSQQIMRQSDKKVCNKFYFDPHKQQGGINNYFKLIMFLMNDSVLTLPCE